MARAWIEDTWTRAAPGEGEGAPVRPTAAQLRNIRSLPRKFRTERFGRGKRWRVTWWIDTPTGRRRRHRSFTTRAQATRYATAMADDLLSGRYIDPNGARRPFRDVAHMWLASKQKPKGASLFRYESDLRAYVLPRWGSVPIGAVRAPDVAEWTRALAAGTAPHSFTTTRTARPLSATSVRRIVRNTFGAVVRYALAQRWIGANPLRGVELPRAPEPARRYLSVREVELLADGAEQVGRPADGLLVRLLAYTGIRIGEALALRVGDLDPAATTARVHRTWTVDRHGRRTEGPVKTWEQRNIAIVASLSRDLHNLTAHRPSEAYLFTTPTGQPLDDHNWRNRVWYPSIAAAGLDVPGLRVHDLRHTYASLAIAAGADVKTLQAQLGHRSAKVTLDTYAGLWPDRLADVANAVDRARTRAMTPK